MRLICDIFTPDADSYGKATSSRFSATGLNSVREIKNKITEEVLEPLGNFKPGMKIEITLTEDWE